MAEELLTATDIHTFYGRSHVLRGVSLSLGRGETVSLLGRNGMGKTTLINSILGIVPHSSGTLVYEDQDISAVPTHEIARRGIAYVPEGRGIFPNLSVKENLLVAARPGPTGRLDWTFDRIMSTFPKLKLRLGNGGDQLSGGEQQMLSIARALLTNPDLLILDEATEGLAPLIAQEIWKVIDIIKETKISTLIVDKNLKAMAKISDRAVILVKGEIVFDGSMRELFSRSRDLNNWLGV
ncbi:MAG: ABC transporter ATP-binding protein [Betaproteobacteria bacterium]|jgi:branched-chain amino acid transport system ATP-binding protein